MPEVLDSPVADIADTAETDPQPLRPEPRFNPIDPKIRETAKALYLQGLPFPEVSATLNLRPSTVRNWAMRDNWKALVTVTKQARQLTVVKIAASDLSANIQAQSSRVRNVLGAEIEAQAAALASKPPELGDLPNTPERQGRTAVIKALAETASTVFDWDSQHTPGIVLVGDIERMEPSDPTPIDVQSSVGQLSDPPDTTIGSVPQ